MSAVFGRRYELYVGKPPRLIEYHNSPTPYSLSIPADSKQPLVDKSSLTGGYIDYRTVDDQFTKVTNPIQMEAKVKCISPKSGTTPQTSTIKVYNLSDKTLTYYQPDNGVVLKAGYDQDKELPIIFVGTIDTVDTVNDNRGNTITTIVCTEGGGPVKSIRYAANFPKGQTYNYILLQMIKMFKDNGIPLGYFDGKGGRVIKAIQEQVVYSGRLAKVFTDLCKSIDYVWFITKGLLYVQPKDKPRPTEFLVLKPESIIGKLTSVSNKAGTPTASADVKPKGIKAKTYLNGLVGLNTYVRIEKGKYAGDYKPTKITFDLNWSKGPWVVDLESEKVIHY